MSWKGLRRWPAALPFYHSTAQVANTYCQVVTFFSAFQNLLQMWSIKKFHEFRNVIFFSQNFPLHGRFISFRISQRGDAGSRQLGGAGGILPGSIGSFRQLAVVPKGAQGVLPGWEKREAKEFEGCFLHHLAHFFTLFDVFGCETDGWFFFFGPSAHHFFEQRCSSSWVPMPRVIENRKWMKFMEPKTCYRWGHDMLDDMLATELTRGGRHCRVSVRAARWSNRARCHRGQGFRWKKQEFFFFFNGRLW